MKAERRHELKTNSLVKTLEDLPNTGRQYAGKVLLAAVVLALIIFLVRYQSAAARRAVESAATDLSNARAEIDSLRSGNLTNLDQEQIAAVRKRALEDAAPALAQILNQSKDPTVRAEALVSRGDLTWQLANAPALPAATTRPSLNLEQSPDDLLKIARDSYQQVLNEYPQQTHAAIAAHFGLAAIAENQSHWDDAKNEYNAVVSYPNVTGAYKFLADQRLAALPDLQKPALIGSFPTTAPATLPVGIAAPTTASSQSTTQPAH